MGTGGVTRERGDADRGRECEKEYTTRLVDPSVVVTSFAEAVRGLVVSADSFFTVALGGLGDVRGTEASADCDSRALVSKFPRHAAYNLSAPLTFAEPGRCGIIDEALKLTINEKNVQSRECAIFSS